MKFEKILCLSGGLDSAIAYYCLNKPQTIFFNCSGYTSAEKKRVLMLAPDTIIDNSLNFSEIPTNTNAFVPNRNLLFAARAAQYSDKIYIAGLKDDMVEDKNPAAFEAMSHSLSKINSRTIEILSLFWGHTKSQIVAWAIQNLTEREFKFVLGNSISCYTPTEEGNECLACPSCFRKWNALWHNGIRGSFNNMPMMLEYLKKAGETTYTEERSASIISCVAEYQEHLALKAAAIKPELETFCFDIDGVLTVETEGHDYAKRTPNRPMIAQVNGLHSAGHKIILNTSRWGTDWTVTKAWLHKYGIQYHALYLAKPKADYYIDDKMLPMEELLNG
jgi:7-cyano-7-deazaguanine synthase in queuosine biosynthesis